MTPCSMRGIECNCPPDQCISAPVYRLSDEPPVFTASNRMLLAIIAFGVIVSLIVGTGMQLHNLEIQYQQEARI